MSEPQSDEQIVSLNWDGQLDLYQHNQDQAQKFLRFLLAGFAIFGISIGTQLVTSWKKLQSPLSDPATIAEKYGINEQLVQSTNDINFIMALAGGALAVLLALNSMKYTLRALQVTPHVEGIGEFNNIHRSINSNNDILNYQHKNLYRARLLARWAGAVAITSEIVIIAALIGSADLLGVANLGAFIVIIGAIAEYSPKGIFMILNSVYDKSLYVYNTGVTSIIEITKRETNADKYTALDVAILLSSFFVFYILAIFGGIFGLTWYRSAFASKIGVLFGIENSSAVYIWAPFIVFLVVCLIDFSLTTYHEWKESPWRPWIRNRRRSIPKRISSLRMTDSSNDDEEC